MFGLGVQECTCTASPPIARRKKGYIPERLPVVGRHYQFDTRREAYGWD